MGNCQQCGQLLKTIPAGISKSTGKPYNAFVACPNKCRQAPQNQQNMQPQPPQAQKTASKQEVDWDKIAAGKVRHAFALEAYKANKKITAELANEITQWVNYVMTGNVVDSLQAPPFESANIQQPQYNQQQYDFNGFPNQ